MSIGFGVQAILWIGFEIFLTYLMILKWKEGNFTIGEFVLFQTISFFILQRLWEFGRSLRTLFRALADAKEMAEIIQKNNTETDSETAENFEIKKGEIEFQNIDFGYDSENNQKTLLFQNFSFSIQAGEKVALVGESGSGKKTITKLLFRFYENFSGKILFDNTDSKEILLSSLRSQISLVPQRPELFHRTIRENLSFAKPDATDTEISEALKKARAFDFVENLPEKMETLVGERGVKLSGGEAQRIAIARSFL